MIITTSGGRFGSSAPRPNKMVGQIVCLIERDKTVTPWSNTSHTASCIAGSPFVSYRFGTYLTSLWIQLTYREKG